MILGFIALAVIYSLARVLRNKRSKPFGRLISLFFAFSGSITAVVLYGLVVTVMAATQDAHFRVVLESVARTGFIVMIFGTIWLYKVLRSDEENEGRENDAELNATGH